VERRAATPPGVSNIRGSESISASFARRSSAPGTGSSISRRISRTISATASAVTSASTAVSASHPLGCIPDEKAERTP
jgi:hypothetical protein